jgi:CRP/FNR family cyclic AMP-dependent transcriptional regulator
MTQSYVELLRLDPSLGAGIDRRDRRLARRLAVAPVVTVPPGRWRREQLIRGVDERGGLGCVVAAGILASDIVLDGRTTTQLLGRGDLLPLLDGPELVADAARIFGAADPVLLAVLDAAFLDVIRRWPTIAAALLVRAQQQLESSAVRQAIAQLPSADQRIVALFWHLAQRWGTARDGHIAVPLAVGHEGIARMVGGRRPTITASLGRLAARGFLTRRANGTWLLASESRALLSSAHAAWPTPEIRLLGERAVGCDELGVREASSG